MSFFNEFNKQSSILYFHHVLSCKNSSNIDLSACANRRTLVSLHMRTGWPEFSLFAPINYDIHCVLGMNMKVFNMTVLKSKSWLIAFEVIV